MVTGAGSSIDRRVLRRDTIRHWLASNHLNEVNNYRPWKYFNAIDYSVEIEACNGDSVDLTDRVSWGDDSPF